MSKRFDDLVQTIVIWNSGKAFRQNDGESYRDCVYRQGVIAGLTAAKTNPWLSGDVAPTDEVKNVFI